MQKKTFDVFYLGNIEKIAIGNSQKRDTEAQLIDRVEEAQVGITGVQKSRHYGCTEKSVLQTKVDTTGVQQKLINSMDETDY